MEQEPIGGILQQGISDHVHEEGVNGVVVSQELFKIGAGTCLVDGRDERSEVL